MGGGGGVLVGSFSNDLEKQKKCEECQGVTELVESVGLAVALLSRPTVVKLPDGTVAHTARIHT
jgi:hypothetical protein